MAADQGKPTLVVLAAGMGSRFGGLKQIEPLGPDGNVLIEYTAYDAIRAGFGKIVFIIQTAFADQFSTLVEGISERVTVDYAYQDQYRPPGIDLPERDKPWGTGHALLAARHCVAEPFALCNADDYYGVAALARAAEYLGAQSPGSRRYGMLGYALRHTLSGQGSVSRGLCQLTPDGQLASIVEHTNIYKKDDAIISDRPDADQVALGESQIASMNFWMMTPSIFRLLDVEMKVFANRNSDSATAEFLLPDIIGELLASGKVSVDCLPHEDAWFGLTHADDLDEAATSIRKMHEDGIYPTPLWQKGASNN